MQFRPVRREQSLKLGQSGRDRRPIRILNPGVEGDKGCFDFGFRHLSVWD